MKYAAIVTRSIWIPGDERSRTAPGHGYPEHSERVTDLIEFRDRSEMEAWVGRQHRPPVQPFRLIQYEELEAVSTTTIELRVSEQRAP